MNVLVLLPSLYGTAPGSRTSIELWERVLTPAGVNLHFDSFESDRLHQLLHRRGRYMSKAVEMIRGFARRIWMLRDLRAFDAVFVYREAALIGPALLERWIARRGKPIIYIVDDPLYIPYQSPFNGRFASLKCFSKVGEICRMSKVVIANSSHHRRFVEQHNSNVWQIPSVVDTTEYSFQERVCDRPVCVGWSGSSSTTRNIRMVSGPLAKLNGSARHRVFLIGGKEFDLPGVEYEAQEWRAETEIEDLRRIDIGLVPLPNNEWNKRKFNLKVVQYMALGIVPICTPLGDNPDIIEPGVTGFLANTPDEWLRHMERLVLDDGLRRRMGRNAAEVAQARYSLAANAPKIVDAFKSALN